MGRNRHFGSGYSSFGEDGAGQDVTLFSDVAGRVIKWRKSDGALAGQRFTVSFPQVAAADVAKTFFVAPAPCKVVSASERHVTVAGQEGTLTIEKLASGEAPGAGDVVLGSTFDLQSTANTPVSKAAVTTAAGTLAAGDALCLKLNSGSAASYALGTITVEMEWA